MRSFSKVPSVARTLLVLLYLVQGTLLNISYQPTADCLSKKVANTCSCVDIPQNLRDELLV